jgi:glycerol-3-phosphate dehydrogenase
MRSDIARLGGGEFDVVVIGAGINGAATARELAAAGYSVLVVDKGDFGSGASARSSRLLHCGLRYLAPGRSILDFVRHPGRLAVALRMARQAMQARSELVRTSPERVEKLRLFFPIYRDGPYRGWQVDAAFRLLETLGPKDVPLDYERIGPDRARGMALIGGLRDFDRLHSVAAFREYQFDWPERLAVDAICEAERLGAVARNHTRARMLAHEPGGGWRVELTDMLSQTPPVTVRGRIVLTMAGVWIDEVLRETKPSARRRIFGTKGAHIMVSLPPECRGLGIATLNALNEPFYCIPWKEFHYFGPTETPYDGDQDNVAVSEDEVGFLIAQANRLLPGLKLKASDIRLTWAGVRPLTYDEAVPFGNRSRTVHDLGPDGLPDAFAMTAGPVMTHRSAGREMTRLVAQRISPQRAAGAPREAAPADTDAHAANLSDILFRRSGIAWSGPVPRDELARLAGEAGARLGWDEDRRAAEIRDFEAEWRRLFGPRRSALAGIAPGGEDARTTRAIDRQ